MRLLLDTNVVLDYLGINEGFGEDAENIIGKGGDKKSNQKTLERF